MKGETFYTVPHPPELFSFFADKDQAKAASRTAAAYEEVLRQLLEQEPETLVLIQSLGGIYPDGMTFYAPPEGIFQADFTEFGAPQHAVSARFDAELAAQIQKSLLDYEKKTYVLDESTLPLPAALLVDQILKQGLSVPRIVVLGVSLEGAQKHYEYGSLIARALASDNARSVVVGSGQLAHTLSKDSVAGFVPEAKEFDEDVIRYLESGEYDKLLNMDPFFIQEVGEDLYRVLCCGLGFLEAHEQKLNWETLSYEAPQGIGYLVGKLSV